jgi:RNase P subunit RPR2
MLLNLSNHPSNNWPENQRSAALQYGEIIDMPFPNISPNATQEEIETLAQEYLEQIKNMAQHQQVTVHLMGELTFCFNLVQLLKREGIPCVASTTERIAVEAEDGSKTSQFKFVQFRPY